MKVLIVDSELLLIKGLKYSLEQDNYGVDSALDGNEALRKIDLVNLILLS